jgi:transposase
LFLPFAYQPPSRSLPEAERIAQLEQLLGLANLKIQVLEERLRLERIKKYGPASETLSTAQLDLLDLEPGVSQAEVQAESQREPVAAPKPKPERRPHPGRQELPAHLPRVERVIACPPEECACLCCGQPTVVIGYDTSEQLDVEPAKYFVTVTKREKRACKKCATAGVSVAPLPARIVDKSLVSDRVILDTVVAKYSDHVPLYRQSAILERETGIEIHRATLDGWVMTVGGLLIPVAGAMRAELLRESYIQADETPVDVQMHDGRGKNHQAYLWQYGHPGGNVVFDFRMGRGRDGPRDFLGNFEGLLQTDGYIAYEKVGGPKLVHAGCWSHSRRHFHDAMKLNPADGAAVRVVVAIDDLFAIDAEARERNLDLEARQTLRLERAPAVLEIIEQRVKAAQAQALPASALGKAANYTLALWARLTRFLEYAELELSNNLAENSMRGVALGRKNWIHLGSREAGPKVAAILSVMETCRRKGIAAREYLGSVLPGLGAVSIQRIAEFTPLTWAARRA